MYTADPLWCDITYSYSVTDVTGSPVAAFDSAGLISFNSDALVREFVFSYVVDLDFCGSVSTDYLVTVTGQTGSVLP